MNVIGIVVEYNPFHNGHSYQINKIKEMYPDSIIVIATSSHFTERGEVSVLSKWDKTRLALEHGVDMVLEIPFVFTNQSADTFSYAALKLLSLAKIDTLVFGSECNDIETLTKIASVQVNNPKFDELVKKYIKEGINYPTALSKAIYKLTGSKVTESNDLLGVSYIKEIIKNGYNITPVTIKRTNCYLDTTSDENIVSALNIRERFKNKENISKYVPESTLKRIRKVDYNKFYNLLRYKIISSKNELESYHLVTEGLHNRIYEVTLKSKSLEDIISGVKSKRFTFNKINRILTNIFVGLSKDEASSFKNIEYMRILGLSKRGKEYFSSIKKDIEVPVFTKFEKHSMLGLELRVTHLYSILVNDETLIEQEIKNHVIMK